jgi:hypothetical protein
MFSSTAIVKLDTIWSRVGASFATMAGPARYVGE